MHKHSGFLHTWKLWLTRFREWSKSANGGNISYCRWGILDASHTAGDMKAYVDSAHREAVCSGDASKTSLPPKYQHKRLLRRGTHTSRLVGSYLRGTVSGMTTPATVRRANFTHMSAPSASSAGESDMVASGQTSR